jgi:molybdopterin-guanine dinucleotide biosynthesis protein A
MSVVSKDSDSVKSLPLKGIAGIILAGGKSSRYGANKAFVEIDGIRLIERVIMVMGSVFERLILITNTPDEYAYLNLPMVEDLIKDLGPIGGILTGLEAISEEYGFFVACDMPFLNRDLIHYIVKVRDDYDAVVPKISWKIEALHALYRKSCLKAIRELIESQEYQTIRFFNKVCVRYIDWNEIRAFDPKQRSFFNVNRPQELLDATQHKG